jgi:glyoxylase-like metal-dependent hydrolase (beta-lactamase superfamily II)
MEVNAYRIGAACFDTGADATALLAPGKPDALFVTHQHADHIADLNAFEGIPVHLPEDRPLTGTFEIGDLTVEARPTPGHSVDGTTYVVTSPSFPAPVAIVGDALFAGSMGGPMVSYPQCLESARTQILSLPGDTVLCPGHGPLTTVALEKANNPFFA